MGAGWNPVIPIYAGMTKIGLRQSSFQIIFRAIRNEYLAEASDLRIFRPVDQHAGVHLRRVALRASHEVVRLAFGDRVDDDLNGLTHHFLVVFGSDLALQVHHAAQAFFHDL